MSDANNASTESKSSSACETNRCGGGTCWPFWIIVGIFLLPMLTRQMEKVGNHIFGVEVPAVAPESVVRGSALVDGMLQKKGIDTQLEMLGLRRNAIRRAWREWSAASDLLVEQKNYAAAADRFGRLAEWLPKSDLQAAALYNVACAEALGGDQRAAVRALHAAVLAGFHNGDHAAADPDLASLNGTPAYDTLVGEMRRRARGGENESFVDYRVQRSTRGIGLTGEAPIPSIFLPVQSEQEKLQEKVTPAPAQDPAAAKKEAITGSDPAAR